MNSQIEKLAATDHTILITGRTGTGKSHLARQIHDRSRRKERKFVTINLATLSENLIESELFGHERGAFSGADCKRTGRLECASGGTAFLDEIGELPLRLQTKLLEALNSHTVSPVGSNREISLDLRIIVATNKDLKKMVKEGSFREDLFFRINTFQLELAPLAGAPERIQDLAERFARAAALKQNRCFTGFHEDFLLALKGYHWPGNVRELKNCMDFSVAMSPNGLLCCDSLPPYVGHSPSEMEAFHEALPFPTDYREAKSQFERTYLHEILRRHGGKINLTARECGLSKVTLIEKIRRYEIDVKRIKFGLFALEGR